jgi:hypothetical protein
MTHVTQGRVSVKDHLIVQESGKGIRVALFWESKGSEFSEGLLDQRHGTRGILLTGDNGTPSAGSLKKTVVG